MESPPKHYVTDDESSSSTAEDEQRNPYGIQTTEHLTSYYLTPNDFLLVKFCHKVNQSDVHWADPKAH